jgi:hypothetical protein
MDLSDEYLGTHDGFDLHSTFRTGEDGVVAINFVRAERGRISIYEKTQTAAQDEVQRLTSPKVMRDVERLN